MQQRFYFPGQVGQFLLTPWNLCSIKALNTGIQGFYLSIFNEFFRLSNRQINYQQAQGEIYLASSSKNLPCYNYLQQALASSSKFSKSAAQNEAGKMHFCVVQMSHCKGGSNVSPMQNSPEIKIWGKSCTLLPAKLCAGLFLPKLA